jgi:hypothetical protein
VRRDVSAIGRQRGEPLAQEAGERFGQRDLAGRTVDASRLERPADLQGVEGVAARQAMHAPEHRRAELQVERLVQEPIDLLGAQRLHRHVYHSVRRKVRNDGRRRRRGSRPLGGDDDDGFALQATEREAHDARRRFIEPLHVVDGDCQRLVRRREAHELEHGERERERLHRLTFHAGPHECHVQRGLLRGWQLPPLCIDQVTEQVVQCGEREPRLSLRRSRDDHPIPAPGGGVQRRLPDRGLPDPRLALQQEAMRPAASTGEERLDQPQLALAADHSRPSARSGDHTMFRRCAGQQEMSA